MNIGALDDGDIARLATITGAVLLAAADDNTPAVEHYVNEAIESFGLAGLYGLCCGLAAAHRALTVTDDESVVGAALVVVGGDVDELPAEARPALFAARFLTAFLNNDLAMCRALFNAPMEARDFNGVHRNVSALINITGDAARDREEANRRANGGPP